ncbi:MULTISPECIES: cytochrome-c peroxidase [unclassified Methylophaga]|jgi:cytochrome c peroxidase|uniref:cytochrome-c peroxidase n=1 Tax=unclassified Methylophaga TaxID=2629249 RepID=UPI000C5128B2|nr:MULTISPECIES: cytochrome-c peroxidase [unclassified Methylophaga]MAL48256.1 cytochrome C biogenesis protein CcsA [Methylophaga sp.]MAP25951.1 cytochrome C biogenesis protein CcsA [Methylophaga sp.]MBP25713.1 cytochrome C biogenesis protein CcsA [Methylophaga sp.]HAD30828.1 cytochrome C biogenesis protein CcsA [Methylophaga sp.]HCC80575.1 cytochrome C biogenesis protein CcsA [Methylophaga sp.]|tara:strand:- start:8516 stop:9517 length:1002 start_codon:yes stop_codon:yes gene_type:complete
MYKTLLVGLITFLNISLVLADNFRNEPIKPIQPFIITEPAKVELGKKLFFDPRLSRSGFISCNSCHNLSMGGSDNLPTSIGHNWQQGPINSPTVLNSSMNLAQFWDGRAADLQEQAAGPIANPMEMAFSHSLAIDVLRSIPQYVAAFNKIYGSNEITLDQVTNAIAAFEETLVTPNSRFDLWLKGSDNALTDTEIAGYQKFKEIGCVACHNGAAVGGSSFQKMGIMEPYQTENPAEGRIAVTGKDADRFSFKVPTLRNVELTYPYFHDGAYWKLEDAVDVMARLQLGQKLEKQDIQNITAFLKTLTGDQPQFAVPQLPPSTGDTPIPVPFEKE